MQAQRGSIRIELVAIIVLVVAALLYVVAVPKSERNGELASTPTPSPSQDETAGWKTYRNEVYGFEFRYPGDLREEIPSEPIGQFVHFTDNDVHCRSGDICFPRSIDIYFFEPRDFQEWWSQTAIENGGEVTFGGVTAIISEHIDDGSDFYGGPSYFVPYRNGSYLKIDFGSSTYDGEIEVILSTFKFTR